MSESIEAGIRKTDIIFKVRAGGSFSKTPENLIRLARQVFSLTALLGVGFRELTFLKTAENLIHLAHQVFSPMAFFGVGSCVLASGNYSFFSVWLLSRNTMCLRCIYVIDCIHSLYPR